MRYLRKLFLFLLTKNPNSSFSAIFINLNGNTHLDLLASSVIGTVSHTSLWRVAPLTCQNGADSLSGHAEAAGEAVGDAATPVGI